MRSVLVALAVAAGVSACSTPYKSPRYASNGTVTSFEGIAHLLDPQRPLDVLFVHGMCTHDASWATEAVRDVYAALGEDPAKVDLQSVKADGTDIVLYQQTLPTALGSIRANAILWSPLTTPLKAQLCYDQTNKSTSCPSAEGAKAYPYDRAVLNRILKDTIMDDCLSDAVIYQGKSRDDINVQMRKAILQATATSGGQPVVADRVAAAASIDVTIPLVVVSESLGSKVVFDAIYKLTMDAATTTAGQRTFDRTSLIFMGANQVPILALADKRLDGTTAAVRQGDGYPEDPIAALIQRRQLSRAAEPSLRVASVVAFTDPNDLLSFILVPSSHASVYPVVDVIVSNTNTYFGLVELPTTAHLGYRANEVVRRGIACGNPASPKCK